MVVSALPWTMSSGAPAGRLPAEFSCSSVLDQRDRQRVVREHRPGRARVRLQDRVGALRRRDVGLGQRRGREHRRGVGVGVRGVEAFGAHDEVAGGALDRAGERQDLLDVGGGCGGRDAEHLQLRRVRRRQLAGEQRRLAALRVPEHQDVVARRRWRRGSSRRGRRRALRAPRSRRRGTGARPACRGPRSRWRRRRIPPSPGRRCTAGPWPPPATSTARTGRRDRWCRAPTSAPCARPSVPRRSERRRRPTRRCRGRRPSASGTAPSTPWRRPAPRSARVRMIVPGAFFGSGDGGS